MLTLRTRRFCGQPRLSVRPLDKVNKSAAQCITGAFRTASLAALEKEAAILPVQLRIERDALNTLTYYLTLPPTHRIRPLLTQAITTAPKNPKLNSILHMVERIPGVRWPISVPARGQRVRTRFVPRAVGENENGDGFDVTLGMEPILPVYAPPWSTPLPITTIISTKEDAIRVLGIALQDERVAEATWYTDGSLMEGRAGGAAVRVQGGEERERLVVPLGNGQVCEGEMEGLCCALERAIGSGNSHVLCVADSQAALRGITSTTPRSGQYRAIRYDGVVREALKAVPHLSVVNLWTPAHIGTAGNEMADEAAKSATEMEPDPDLFISLTTVRRLIHLQVLGEWEERWRRSKTGGPLRAIDRSPPSLIPSPLYSSSSLSRKDSSTISQLRTGPTHLNSYRHKAGFVMSPRCEACGAASESRAHYLLACPRWEHLRQPLHDACREVGFYGSLHLSPILSHPKLLKPLAEFVRATGRFE